MFEATLWALAPDTIPAAWVAEHVHLMAARGASVVPDTLTVGDISTGRRTRKELPAGRRREHLGTRAP